MSKNTAVAKSAVKSKAVDSEPAQTSNLCKHSPPKGDPCTAEATTPYGYCMRHSGTLSAKKAKQEYEESLKKSSKSQPTPQEEPESDNESEASETEEPARPTHKTTNISVNKFGNFEHPEFHIVFKNDKRSKKPVAVGVQEKNGSVRELNSKDKEICRRKGWPYITKQIESEDDTDESEAESEASEPSVAESEASEASEEPESESEASDAESEEEASDVESENEVSDE